MTPEDLLVRIAGPTPTWFRDAACRGMHPDLFFPGRGEPTAQVKAICAGCPVRDDCAEYGRDEQYGIWGGLSGRQLREGRRRRVTIIRHGQPMSYRVCARRNGEACRECLDAHNRWKHPDGDRRRGVA